MNSKTKKITYGNVEVLEEDLSPKNVKERITIFVDQDILDAFRDRAAKMGSKYQTLINQSLRESLKKPDLEERVDKIERKLKIV